MAINRTDMSMSQDQKNCKIAVVQMNSNHIVEDNFHQLRQLINHHKEPFDLLMLPENFAHMPRNEQERTSCAEPIGEGSIQSFLQSLAQQQECWIVAGSVPIKSVELSGTNKLSGTKVNAQKESEKDSKSKIYQACLVYDETGSLRHRYNKIHLFDVTLPNGEVYEESRYIEFGDVNQDPVVKTPWGLIGLSICYDVRFPEFYRAMPEEVFLVSVPAAFTQKSGEAHWDILLKARAIENQVYVSAPAQTGQHSNGRSTWGHSSVIDPWGKIVCELGNEQKIASANINFRYIEKVRREFPCLHHKRTLKS